MARVSSFIVSGSLVFMGLATVRAAPLAPLVVPCVQPVAITGQLPNQEQIRAFAGTIVSQYGGTFVLQDDVNKTVYGLDDQALAAKFVDKKVLVTGTLDKTATIHVKSIEEQKA
ncbi:MAG TPA: DUF5818 domain-containing protein [Candidatus Acidoferrales bacterium]|nr:DUF5818 domain-containing protein [Candidatus Acidoferrales bacterium]